jgi:peptidoglycan/xylan/chitin deacetylase (PgdA/CDA1 family)
MSGAWASSLSALEAGRLVRVVNYHNTPHARRDVYARQFEALAARSGPVTEETLEHVFEHGAWPEGRPVVIPVFYEGYRDHVEVAAPLLEEFGLVGWFFVPTAFPGIEVTDQVEYALAHDLGIVDDEYADGRHAMSWEELEALGTRHVIAAHSANHVTAASVVGDALVEREIVAPYRALERALGRPPTTFAWLYGQGCGVNQLADDALASTGYRYLFSNTKVQRLPSDEGDAR